MFRKLDLEEDHLNMLPVGHLVVTKDIEDVPEHSNNMAPVDIEEAKLHAG